MPCLMLEFIIRIESRQKAFPHQSEGTLFSYGVLALQLIRIALGGDDAVLEAEAAGTRGAALAVALGEVSAVVDGIVFAIVTDDAVVTDAFLKVVFDHQRVKLAVCGMLLEFDLCQRVYTGIPCMLHSDQECECTGQCLCEP